MKNIDNTKPIGFFDSGVGGLSVLSRFRKLLPMENTIYIGDTIHLPYGNKTKEQLIGYAKSILNFFAENGVKAVVIACNTSSAQAYDTIKSEYDFPIYPIIQSSSKVIATSGITRVGVFATESTIKSEKYAQELTKYNPNIKVKSMASKNWVGIVEGVGKNIEEDIKNIKNEISEMMDFKPEKIILGCTHYPYLMNEFVKYAPQSMFIDPAEIFVKFIFNDLQKRKLLNTDLVKGREEFYVTSSPKDFVNNAKIFYKLNTLPKLINL